MGEQNAKGAASVIITTKNRKEELRKALDSVVRQTMPLEILVMDDGSSDGTAEMVTSSFSGVKVFRSVRSIGLIAQRNRAALEASTSYLFSLDDDAEFASKDIVERTLSDFDHPQVGAVAIPHVDTLSGKVVNAPAPNDGKVWCVASYVGTAHAVRKDVFVQLGGYCSDLVHQGEESDYCIRMLAAGYVVRLGHSNPIRHNESPRRSYDRMDFYGRRNDLLFGWRYAPNAWLAPHLIGTTINGIRTAVATRRFRAHVRGAAVGWQLIVSGQVKRTPVSKQVYRLFRKLKKRSPQQLESIRMELPAINTVVSNSNRT